MSEIEIQRELLLKITKQTIRKIKKLQIQLEVEKKECAIYGHYEDCGSFYQEEVIRTEAIISELIEQKITFQKWRKKLKYDIVSL